MAKDIAFISYRRKPSAPIALLVQTFLETKHNLHTYVDTTRTDSTVVQFPERLMRAIESAPVFVCLLGEREGQHTLTSEWVLKEIVRAYELNKFCVPVFQESYKPIVIEDALASKAVDYMLSFDGVHVFDEKNLHFEYSMQQLANLLGIHAERKAREQAEAQRIAQEQAEAQRKDVRVIVDEHGKYEIVPYEFRDAEDIIYKQDEAGLFTEQALIQRKPRRQTYRSASTLFNRIQVVAIAVFSIVLIAGALVIITAPRNTPQATATNTSLLPTSTLDVEAKATLTALNLSVQAISTPFFADADTVLTPPPTSTPTPTPTLTPLEEALQRARNFTGTQNSDWQPFEQDFDGVTMVLVPVGCFMMGSDNGDSDERPVHEQCFDEPFWIDKYEVTNEQYGSTGCTDWSSQSDQPRNCVSWFDANDYCQSRNAQLPTEAQWEYAARGVESWVYPWGNDFVGDNAVYNSNSGSRTAPVGSYPQGASWVGAMDMAGNVWEWTSSLFEPYPYDADDGREQDTGDRTDVLRVLRGGSFDNSTYYLRSAIRGRYDPYNGLSNSGLRCLRSY